MAAAFDFFQDRMPALCLLECFHQFGECGVELGRLAVKLVQVIIGKGLGHGTGEAEERLGRFLLDGVQCGVGPGILSCRTFSCGNGGLEATPHWTPPNKKRPNLSSASPVPWP